MSEQKVYDNAFVGKMEQPTPADLAAALGPSKKELWDRIVAELAAEFKIDTEEWKCYSPKMGWSMRLKHKKRNIIHFGPRLGGFMVMLILGAKAVAAARQSGSAKMLKLIDEAPRYPEGTGIRITVTSAADIPVIKKFVAVKLAN